MAKAPKPAAEKAQETAAPAATQTPAPADAGTEGAAVVQQATPQVAAAAPTEPEPEAPPERRAATVASRIDHDGEIYLPDGVLMLTETEFRDLSKAGALVETSWNDCIQDE